MPTEGSRSSGKPPKAKLSYPVEWTAQFTPRRLYQDLCFTFRGLEDRKLSRQEFFAKRRKCLGPLKLSKEQFEAARTEFVARGVSRFWRRMGQEYQKRKKAPVVWQDVDWSTIGPRLEHLRLQMYFARTTEQYKAASRDFDRIIRKLKPRQRKEHTIKRDPLHFLSCLAERHFLWIVFKGEYVAGMTISDLRRQYAYCQDVTWDALKERLLESPQHNAFKDLSGRFNLSANSMASRCSPSRWFED